MMLRDELTPTERLVEREAELASYSGDDRVVLAADLRHELAMKEKPTEILKSGIAALDKLIEGFERGELTVVTGPTKGGKTLLCQTLTWWFTKNAHNVLWFPYEAGGLRFMRGFGDNLPTFCIPKKLTRNHLGWVKERIWEAQLKYQIEAVFIDHLHFLFDMARSRNPSLEIGGIMRTLVGITHEFNIAMFLIAHMGKVTAEREPVRGDIRDSGFIECECDNTLAIWRSTTQDSVRSRLKVIHNRRLGVFDKVIELQKIGLYLSEVEKSQARH